MPTKIISNNTTGSHIGDYHGVLDAQIQLNGGTSNYGGIAYPSCYTGANAHHLLLKFGGLSSISKTVTVSGAVLNMGAKAAGTIGTQTAYRILRPVVFGTGGDGHNRNLDTPYSVCWNEYGSGVAWATAGGMGTGDIDPTPLATTAAGSFTFNTSAALDTYVQNVINGTWTDYGILITSDATVNLQTTANAGTSQMPYLSVPYTVVDAVTYDGNNNTGGTVPTDGSSPYTPGSTVTILGNTGNLVRSGGYVFVGWNTQADGGGTTYQADSTFTINADTTLYAKWVLKYTITYDGNGNTGGNPPVDSNSPYPETDPVTVLAGSTGFIKTNWEFFCWNTAANGTGTTYLPGQTFTMGSSSLTLYAIWAVPGYIFALSSVISASSTAINNNTTQLNNLETSNALVAGVFNDKIDLLSANIGTNGAGLTAIGDTRLDYLDASISSRMSSSGYVGLTAEEVRTEMDSNSNKLVYLDAYISSRMSSSGYIGLTAEEVRTEMDSNSTKLAHLDVNVSTRLSSSGYIAPANVTINTIETMLSNVTYGLNALLTAVNSRLPATGGTVASVTNAVTVSDKTDYALSSTSITAIVNAILAMTFDDGIISFEKLLQALSAVFGGKMISTVNSQGTGTITCYNQANSVVISGTFVAGSRTSVTW